MAAQTDVSSTNLSAQTVGNAFVSQYYRILHQNPELVYRFYQDSSTMSRPGADGALVTVSAMEKIKDFILSLECEHCKAEILTADTQASHMNGVIVLVTGCLTGKDNVRRKFTESFFLAPQENGYYVLNDAFRFIDEEKLPVVNSVEEKDVEKSAPASPVVPIEEPVEATKANAENHAPAAEDKSEAINTSKDEQKSAVTENAAPQAVVSGNKIQPVAETLSNGHVDAPKKSYASLLKNMKEGATTTLVHVPSNATKAATQKTSQKPAASSGVQQTRAAPPPTASASTAQNGSNGVASNTDQAEEKDNSVYTGGLPFDATPPQLEREFSRFGPIKRNGIQVRSNKGYCFGFVEYEDPSGKQKALEAGKLLLGRREVTIEVKKTSTRVVNGVSTNPHGRGGYRNDGFRGRGNYSNGGRGYVRNDFGKRNGEVPSRGSRDGDGFVHQNGGGGGGRNARQGAAPK